MRRLFSAPTDPRLIGVGSVSLGMTLLAAPHRVSAYVSDDRALAAGWVRLLGARYVAQGVAQLRWPRPTVLRAAAVTDGLHALSMVAVAVAQPRYRRAAALSAVVAAAGVAANAWTARQPGVS